MTDSKTAIRYTGAVYTPMGVATAILKRCALLLGNRELHVLEPSVGDGAFLSRLLGEDGLASKVTSIDIDRKVISDLEQRYRRQSNALDFVRSDFVRYAIDRNNENPEAAKFDLIVGNPPFIRRHNFSEEIRESLEHFAITFDYPLNRLKNIWPAFLIASARLIADDGIVALVLPYELLTVEYGQKALNHIQDQFERVDIIVSKQKAFQEIEQDAIILIAQKKPMEETGLFVTRVPDFENLDNGDPRKIEFRNGVQGGIELNSYLLPIASVTRIKALRSRAKAVLDCLSSAPGVVSAANDFFIRTKADVLELNLSDYAKPILKKGMYSSTRPVFTSAEFDKLAEREPCFLLHMSGDLNELSPAARAYILKGEEKGIHLRYKCRHRPNWYHVPLVKPEEAFAFKRSHSHPRVLINEAGTHTTDTAYGLRFKAGYSARGFCFSFYNSLTMLFAETNGRFYGGGVLELSPNEFRGLPIIYHEPSDIEFSDFLKAHKAADGDINAILDFSDLWITKHSYLTSDDLAIARASWSTVRSHRMRHSGRPTD